MKKEEFAYDLKATGYRGNLYLIGNKIIISHKVTLMYGNAGGNKEVELDKITAIQFKETGLLRLGFIEFSYLGGFDGSNVQKFTNANAILFKRNHNEEFINIKNEIEKRRSNIQNMQITQIDIPSQIKKLSELKEQGILSDEEFKIKKTELLAKM
jgi:hypothetical protein